MTCAVLISALKDPRLTRTDLAVLGILLSDVSGMPRKAVAEAAGCAPSSVPRSARKLEALGYVERIIDDRTHGKRAKPTGYRIKADTYQPGYVSSPIRTETDTLGLVVDPPKKPQNVATRISPDTSKSPPKENNQTPQELNPEREELGGEGGPGGDLFGGDGEPKSRSRAKAARQATDATMPREPTARMLEHAAKNNFFNGTVAKMFADWRDWHISKGTKIADHEASWRTWVGKRCEWRAQESVSVKPGLKPLGVGPDGKMRYARDHSKNFYRG